MDLEEQTIEQIPERCESCGTRLTAAEKQVILESGSSVALCATCSMEEVPLDEEVAEEHDV